MSCVTLGLAVVLLGGLVAAGDVACKPEPGTPPNAPMGVGIGIAPGRVGWAHRKNVCTWDGKTNYWWSNQFTNQTAADEMVQGLIMTLAGGPPTVAEAWDKIFRFFNQRKYDKDEGYKPGELLTIKINLNTGSYDASNVNGPNPQALKAVLRSLIQDAGVKDTDIIVFDTSRVIPPGLFDPPEGTHKEFPGIRFIDNQGRNGRIKGEPSMAEDSRLTFSSSEVPNPSHTFSPNFQVNATYHIDMGILRAHTMAGVTLSAKNYFGSMYRPDDTCGENHWCPAKLHTLIDVHARPMGVYNPLVDLLGFPQFGGKALMFILEGMYGATTQNTGPPVKWQSTPFNDTWPCSILASLDPVAVDSVAFDIMRNEPALKENVHGCVDNYLHEASQLPDPPSKTVYKPAGKPLSEPLGVHEHWNNAEDKEYSRNLKTGDGIELVRLWE